LFAKALAVEGIRMSISMMNKGEGYHTFIVDLNKPTACAGESGLAIGDVLLEIGNVCFDGFVLGGSFGLDRAALGFHVLDVVVEVALVLSQASETMLASAREHEGIGFADVGKHEGWGATGFDGLVEGLGIEVMLVEEDGNGVIHVCRALCTDETHGVEYHVGGCICEGALVNKMELEGEGRVDNIQNYAACNEGVVDFGGGIWGSDKFVTVLVLS
jgi:hypothetical protein